MNGTGFSEPDFKALFESMAGPCMVLDPQLRIVAATDAFLKATLTNRDDIVGRFVFDIFPDNPAAASPDGVQSLSASFQRVLESRVTDVMGLQRHEVRKPEEEGGAWEVRYWKPVNSPILNGDGSVTYIVHRLEHVTELAYLEHQGGKASEAPDAERSLPGQMETEIADRRRAEDALRESEARLRATLHSILDEVWIVDAQGRLVLVNGKVWEHLGITPGLWENVYDAIGSLEIFYPDGTPREDDQSPLPRALRGESLTCEEIVRHLTTGELRRREVSSSPIRDAAGGITGAVCVARDITWRHQTEEALRKSEAKYRQLFDSMQEAFLAAEAVFDSSRSPVDYRILEANPALERLTGLRRRDLVGRLMSEAMPGADPYWIDIMGKVAQTGEPAQFERYSSALNRWFEARAYSPAPGQFATTFLDSTDRKRAEEALAAAIQRLDAHMDNSPLAIIEFDPQFRVTRWSKEAERVFGWSAEEILGCSIQEMTWVYEDDVEAVRQISRDMMEGSRPRNVSVNRNYRKDGSVVECEWYNSAIYDSSGHLSSILSQILDITERKRTEQRLRLTQKLESVGLLAGGIAHDFNNLLTGIMGNASMVLDEVEEAPAERIREVISSAERAANLTRQLLAYSGKGQFVVRDLDVSEAVQEITSLVEFSIPKSVRLAVNVQRRLPIVRMDPSQLQQILMNLVINAGEAIGEGQPGEITVATSMADIETPFVDAIGADVAAGRYVLIAVSDTGSGIEREQKAKIFDPFFTTKFTGRGLGLAAVAGILRSHKGAVTLDSTPGRGSTFRVFLPASEWHAGAMPEQPDAEKYGTILVVDDDSTVRNFIGAVLRREGFRVLLASDGRDALGVCEREGGRIDAAILDVIMPLMGAHELMPALKLRRPEMRIILTSGYSESEARRLCTAYPGVAFIQKPYTAQEVAGAVYDLLRYPPV